MSDIYLCTASRPENVAVVRHVLDGMANGLSLPIGILDDIKTVVSEACNNVVVHAYDGEQGPMAVELILGTINLEIIVRDYGRGIRPSTPPQEPTVSGVGLSVIQAFTDRVELRGHPDNGTEVHMEFTLPSELHSGLGPSREAGQPQIPSPSADHDALLWVRSGPITKPVLSHFMVALAANAGFSVDRLSDIQLMADAIGAHTPSAYQSEGVRIGATVDKRALLLKVGSLRPGGGQQLLRSARIGQFGDVIERLSQTVEVKQAPDGETLTILVNETL